MCETKPGADNIVRYLFVGVVIATTITLFLQLQNDFARKYCDTLFIPSFFSRNLMHIVAVEAQWKTIPVRRVHCCAKMKERQCSYFNFPVTLSILPLLREESVILKSQPAFSPAHLHIFGYADLIAIPHEGFRLYVRWLM